MAGQYAPACMALARGPGDCRSTGAPGVGLPAGGMTATGYCCSATLTSCNPCCWNALEAALASRQGALLSASSGKEEACRWLCPRHSGSRSTETGTGSKC